MKFNKKCLIDDYDSFAYAFYEHLYMYVCLNNEQTVNKCNLFQFKELIYGGSGDKGLSFIFHLADLYSRNSNYFLSIGDPELPLWDRYSLEESPEYKAHSMMFDFDDQTSLCSLNVPNILGFNEPDLNDEYREPDELLAMFNITEEYDVYSDINHYGTYYFHNTYLFSDDIDFAIEHGYADELLSSLKYSHEMHSDGYRYDVAIVTEESPLHLKNLLNRRTDLNINDPNVLNKEQYIKNCQYKYNIIFRGLEQDGGHYEFEEYDAMQICDYLQNFINCSESLFSIKKVHCPN